MKEKLKKIKILVLDVDGTMTDGGIYITEEGKQFKKYNAKDGMGIKEAIKNGIEVGIISHSSRTEMVEERANMLGMRFLYVGQKPKLEVLDKWCAENNWSKEEVAYVGDDINDLEIMQAVGVAVCPADAVHRIKDISDIKLSRNGGDCCVREFIDDFLLPAVLGEA